MKVYVITYWDYESPNLESVWSTQEAASAEAERLNKEWHNTRLTPRSNWADPYAVQEREVRVGT